MTTYFLPAETLCMILEYTKDQKTNHSLCLASRMLNNLATPQLYSKFVVAQPDGDSNNDLLNLRLRKLLRTLSIRPERASLLKYVNTGSWLLHTTPCEEIKDLNLLHFLQSIMEGIYSDDVAESNGLRNNNGAETEIGTDEMLMICLFKLCPNMEELDVIMPFGRFRQLHTFDDAWQKVFPSLHTLNLHHDLVDDGVLWDDILPFLKLPTIVSVRARVDQSESPVWINTLDGSSNVSDLHFTNSCMDRDTLNEALRIPRALHSLYYSHHSSFTTMDVFNVGWWSHSLRDFCASTLESLTILIRSSIHLQNLANHIDMLSAFAKLQYLEVSLPLLVPYLMMFGSVHGSETHEIVQRLPESLKWLVLRDCDKDTEIYACLALVKAKKTTGALPNLQHITLGYRTTKEDDDAARCAAMLGETPSCDGPSMAMLQLACDEVRVDLAIDRPKI